MRRWERGTVARMLAGVLSVMALAVPIADPLPTTLPHYQGAPAAPKPLLENLADGVEPPDPAALRTALAQTERLGRLVTQLLDLSKLESGGLELRPVSFGMRPLLEQAARECVLGDRPVRLKVCVEPGDLHTTGDPERLHQVIANLLDNAVRHSPPEGRVWLSAHAATARPHHDRGRRRGAGHPAR